MGDATAWIDAMRGGGLMSAFLVIVGLMIFIKLIDGFVEIIKKWRKPSENTETQKKKCAEKFESDQRRLDALEAGIPLLLRGVCELLGHELHNGNSEGMQKAENDIKQWMYDR